MLLSLEASAQYKLQLVVANNTTQHKYDSLYAAGNFNNWNPANIAYSFTKETNKQLLQLQNLTAGVYEFKFTRGSWQKVACSKTGADVANNVIVLSSDTVMYYNIDAWKDDFTEIEKTHTASTNVKVIDTAFFIPQLNRSRRITLYLPEHYEKSSSRYPVLYMHDGQNLFDEYSAGFGEWGVDECLDSLVKKGYPACIVVAVDNGPKRLNEYNPFYTQQFGKGEGDAYLDFLVTTLKPFIDKQYRTLAGKQNTIIAGSSMGALISYYAFLKYPNVFGKVGVFSPAFWAAEEIKAMTDSLGKKINGMLFFYMGVLEGEKYMTDMMQISDKLGASSSAFIYTATDVSGLHNEQAWRKWFAEFYQWIMADGYNYIIKISD